MKKWMSMGLVAILCFGILPGISSAAGIAPTFVTVIQDGLKVQFPDAQPFINKDERTLVPVRFVAENMGAGVKWVDETDTVIIQRENQEIRFSIGENKALVNGSEKAFDTKAIMSGGRTFVPLRFVSDVLGAEVKWDGPTTTVYITTSGAKTADNAKYDAYGRKIRTTNLPKNAKDYPYILEDTPNEMYEMKYPFSKADEKMVSSELYKTPEFTKDNVDIWMDRLKKYGTLWVNVDYTTIGYQWVEDLFGNKIQYSGAELKYIKQYVDWVKENQIQIEGYIDPESSMIYDDGFGHFNVRSRFRFRLLHFKENKNLFYDKWFPDNTFEKNVWYEGYSDIQIGTNVGGNWGKTLRLLPNSSLFFNYEIHRQEE